MVYIGSLEYDVQLQRSAGIIIFGAGSMFPLLLKKMEQLNLSGKVIAICDNNAAMQGERVAGILVISPVEACRKYRDMDYVVYNQYFMENCKQLQENNITGVHLVRQGSL